MKMTLEQFFDMLDRGMTPDEYEKRWRKLRRLSEEKYCLMDAIDVLEGDPRAEKKKARLEKVEAMINDLL